MTLPIRRVIYSIFIISFLIIAPLLVLYATGYRYDFKRNTIEKTGILYIESMPKNANIHLDAIYAGKTPKRFSRILPGHYQVEISKAGYHTWTKRMEVNSNLTTFSEEIFLFRKTLPFNIIDGGIEIFSPSTKRDKLIYSNSDKDSTELRLHNLNNNSDLLIVDFEKPDLSFGLPIWSDDGSQAIVPYENASSSDHLVIDTTTLRHFNLSDISTLKFEKFKWENQGNEIVYALSNNDLYRISLPGKNFDKISESQIQDFHLNGSGVYVILKKPDGTYLSRIDSQGEIIDIKLESSTDFSFEDSIENTILLLDKQFNDMFLIHTAVFENGDIGGNLLLQDKAKAVAWSPNRRNLLYYSDFELKTFDSSSNSTILLTRYSTPIKRASWLKSNNYVIYQVGASIRSIENTVKENKNDTELTNVTAISDFAINENTSSIYFNGRVGQQAGIFQLPIQ